MDPGIQRDGTSFATNNWSDGTWVRFQRKLPRKMGGYYANYTLFPNIPRGIYITPQVPNFNFQVGDSANLYNVPTSLDGFPVGAPVLRTPAAFVNDTNRLWNFDTMYSDVGNNSILIAHAPPNLYAIDSTTETPIYYGDSFTNAPLVETGLVASGGVVALHPYLFYFGNNGSISWTAANDPTTPLNSVRATAQKVVAGAPVRAGNNSPGGLFWSLDSLIRCTNVGPAEADFGFDNISGESSILSSKSIVQYDDLFFWCGVDRFLFYNGTVQELPNNTNLNFFFNNLNYSQRQKVWGTKVTQYGEIWWFFPMGDSQECNHAIIYNKRENCWYDTEVNRSCGYFSQIFGSPVWCDNTQTAGTYISWVHENGVDQQIDNIITPIESNCETSDIAFVSTDPGRQRPNLDRTVYLYRVEPDFVQTGDMTLTISGKAYANSDVVSSAPYSFSPTTEKIDMREQRREMTLRFESNVAGGDFQMGQILMVARIGDQRP